MAKKSKRFVMVYDQSNFMNTVNSEIWVDRETRVCYLWHGEGNASMNASAGITVLVDADGKPLLWNEPLED